MSNNFSNFFINLRNIIKYMIDLTKIKNKSKIIQLEILGILNLLQFKKDSLMYIIFIIIK